MSYSLAQAAKATGKDRSTIYRAIKSGRISASIGESGSFEIDPAELHRVFPPFVRNELQDVATQTNAQTEATSENSVLRAKVEFLGEMIKQIESERDHLRNLLSDEVMERRKLTAALTNLKLPEAPPLEASQPETAKAEPPPAEEAKPPRKSLFARIFGT